MGDEGPVRSKKHSQDKVLRAFLEHVTGTHPAVQPGKPGSPPPAEGSAVRPSVPPPSGPVVVPARVAATPPHGRRVSQPYSVTPTGAEPAAEKQRDAPTGGRRSGVTTPSRPAGRPRDVGSAPTEIRPSPHVGVTPPVRGARSSTGSSPVVVAPPLPPSPVPPAVGARPEIGAGAVLGGKYRLSRLLGRGGVGEVYEATHDVIGLRVAVKLIRYEYAGNSELNARFLQEARAAAAVGHPGIVQVHDVGTSPDGRTYLVMEYLEGEDLEKVLARQRQLPVGEIAAVLIDALDALSAAHAKGIIHRDMKPENVFLVPGRKGDRVVKLLDFGIARLADEAEATIRLTRPGSVMGTPYYMSPEQARGDPNVDSGVDIYAVGVMLYEALTGQLPFSGSSYNEVLSKVLAQPFPSVRVLRPDVPEEIERIIFKACARQRSDRYADALDFGDALTPFRPQPASSGRSDSANAGLATGRTPTAETPLPTISRPSVPPSTGTAVASSDGGESVEAAASGSPSPAGDSTCADSTEFEPGPARKRRPLGVYAALGLVLLVLVGVGLFFGFRGDGRGDDTRKAAGDPSAATESATIRIRVLGAPPQAEIRFDGRTMSDDFIVPRAPEDHTVEVQVPGLPSVVRTVRPSSDLTLDLTAEFAGSGSVP
jgi:serine/threonine protein kinase